MSGERGSRGMQRASCGDVSGWSRTSIEEKLAGFGVVLRVERGTSDARCLE